MLRIILVVAVIALTVYGLVDVGGADGDRVRRMPRWMWFVVVLLMPVVGTLLWLLLGQPARPTDYEQPPHARGPDDDPDFLRRL